MNLLLGDKKETLESIYLILALIPVRTNLMARVSQIQGHEIRVVLYARLDDDDCLSY